MTVFDVLQDVLFKKKGDLLTTTDAETELVPFMINRWISMYSESNAILINETSNVVWPVIQTKQEWYKFYLTVIPKSKYKKINYIKKEKPEKKSKDDIDQIGLIAQSMQISRKEAQFLVDQQNREI